MHGASGHGRPHTTSTRRPRRPRPLVASAAGVTAVLLCAGACGGASADDGDSAAPGASKSAAGDKKSTLAYAKCMRENGVRKFPAPNAQGGLDLNGDTLGVDPRGPVFKAADKTCQPILEKVAGGLKEFQSGGPGPAPR